MDRHPDLRYRRAPGRLECLLRGRAIGHAHELKDGRWELRVLGDDYPTTHDDYDQALRELASWARRYAWAQTTR